MGCCKKGKKREITSAMDLWYMNQLRIGLTSINSWPYKALGEKEPWVFPLQHHKFLLALWIVVFWSQFTYIRLNYAKISLFELGNCIITIMINMIDNQRITIIMTKSYQKLTREFVQEMHLFYYKHKSEYSMKVYHRMNRYCTLICKFLYAQMTFAVVFFNLMPLLHNVWTGMLSGSENRPVNGTFLHSVYYAVPFDIYTALPGYIGVFFFNIVISCWVGVCFTMFDFYLAVVVCQLWGHLNVIEHELKNFPLPADIHSIRYSPKESDEIAIILKRNIHLHATCIRFVHKSSIAFGPMLATSFTFYQIGCCILLLECSIVDSMALAKYGVTFMVFQQLFSFSVLFEFLGSKSEKLVDAVYGVPWEYMGVRERKLVQVFLMKVQTPIRMKALGLVPVGVNTMAAILKTSISYFVMLKTLAAE